MLTGFLQNDDESRSHSVGNLLKNAEYKIKR